MARGLLIVLVLTGLLGCGGHGSHATAQPPATSPQLYVSKACATWHANFKANSDSLLNGGPGLSNTAFAAGLRLAAAQAKRAAEADAQWTAFYGSLSDYADYVGTPNQGEDRSQADAYYQRATADLKVVDTSCEPYLTASASSTP